jgi:hypothetical protein
MVLKPAMPASPTAQAKAAGTGTDAPPFPPINSPGGIQPNKTPMAVNFPATPKKALPPEANTPVLIQKILDVTTLEDLRSTVQLPNRFEHIRSFANVSG